MKLHFKKEDGSISITIVDESAECTFSYEELIRKLYKDRKIDESDFTGEFSGDERNSINALVREITEGFVDKHDATSGDGFMGIPF